MRGGGRGSAARRAPQTQVRSPSNGKRLPRALAPVVAAERAFAQHSIDHGMKPAFLAYAAPDGVIIDRRGPSNAIEAWGQREPAPAGLLTWWPAYSDVSRAGDLGWTPGPYEFREKPSDEKPAEHGYYARVWKRERGGVRRVVFNGASPSR